jgi:hypothetical protein
MVGNPEVIRSRHHEISNEKSARLETKFWMLARL